jgi:hypothetical protein
MVIFWAARATARLCGTAGSGRRAATPGRVALEARVWPRTGQWYGLWGGWAWGHHAARWRLRGMRRRSRSRVARLAAGSTRAGGSMPPRRRRAIWWAASWSCCTLPPCMACLYGAGPRTHGSPARAPNAARQVPGEETCNGEDEPSPRRGHDRQPRVRRGVHRTVPQALAALGQAADRPRAGVPTDPPVNAVWLRVKAPALASSPGWVRPRPTYHRGLPRRGPQAVSSACTRLASASLQRAGDARRSASLQWNKEGGH